MVARPPAAARADRRRGGHGARGRPVRARPPGAGVGGHLSPAGAPRPLPGRVRAGAAAARPVSADLLVAVARQLAGRSEDAQLATRFIRAAAPAAMRARQTRVLVQL